MLVTVLFVIGITAAAMTGAIAAGREKMDLFGVIMIAEITALGGGSIRDPLLGNYPLVWVKTPEYLLVVAGAALLTVLISRAMAYLHRLFLMLDAIGLAAFTVIGINIALNMGHGFIIALVAATITGVFGGVLRDIFSNRIPLVFRTELYATCVLFGVIVYWVMMLLGVHSDICTITTLLVVFTTRMLALRFEWSLPVFHYQERTDTRSPADQIWKGGGIAPLLNPRRWRDRLRLGRKRAAKAGTGNSGAETAPSAGSDSNAALRDDAGRRDENGDEGIGNGGNGSGGLAPEPA